MPSLAQRRRAAHPDAATAKCAAPDTSNASPASGDPPGIGLPYSSRNTEQQVLEMPTETQNNPWNYRGILPARKSRGGLYRGNDLPALAKLQLEACIDRPMPMEPNGGIGVGGVSARFADYGVKFSQFFCMTLGNTPDALNAFTMHQDM